MKLKKKIKQRKSKSALIHLKYILLKFKRYYKLIHYKPHLLILSIII